VSPLTSLLALALLSPQIPVDLQVDRSLAGPPPFESDIKRFEARDRVQAPEPGGVVFVGSSSIVRWTTLKADFPGVNCINRGFGGSAISDSVRYARRVVTKYKPRMVVFFAGTNDLASGKSPKTVIEDFKKFSGIVRQDLPDTELVFISITPAPSRRALWPAMKEVNSAVAALCRNGNNMRYIDFFDQFLGPEGEPRPELFVGDQLHMNPKGYAIWVAGLKDIVTKG
jgi:lysophospholipase L1-like esterase